MMLEYNDVLRILPEFRGVQVPISFKKITFSSEHDQEKGLFVFTADDDLQQAIHQGAVAAVWKKDVKVPFYAPNHFPIFFADEPVEAVVQIIDQYKHKISIGQKRGKTELIMPKINNERYRDIFIQIRHLLQNDSNREGEQ